ncbi:MAG: hypothetical protein EOO97_00925, partial [Pedobacter sp.]
MREASPTLHPGRQGIVKLRLIEGVIQAFHEMNIQYCHWKSNEHLAASMTGETDLDLLFDEAARPAFEAIMREFGFKRFVPVKEKKYKDIEDYIGLDEDSGKIIHLHTHFRLTLGESYLKGYQLNLEQNILESRVFDDEFGIYTIKPSFELLLLFFRYALKLRNRDILKFYLGKDVTYSKNVLAEYNWLRARCSDAELAMLLKSLFTDYLDVYHLVTKPFTRSTLVKLSPILKRKWKDQRLYSPMQAALSRWYREFATKAYRKWAKYSKRPIVLQRVRTDGGLIVAVVGADGSGKSTVIDNLKTTFKRKIDVFPIY